MEIKRPAKCHGAAAAASLAVLLLLLLLGASPQGTVAQSGGLTRGSFPEGFVFGTASAAYQVTRCCVLDFPSLLRAFSWKDFGKGRRRRP
jgi:hypothetical protein